MMRCARLVTCFGIVLVAGVTRLQAQSASEPRWYGEFTVGPTLGHKSDVSIGGEGGGRLTDVIDVFVEIGHMGNVGNTDLEARAQKIADFIGGTVGTTAYKMTYFDVGAKYRVMDTGPWHPYVGVGLGFGTIKPEVRWAVGGNDVTDQLPSLGVQLGSDLSESHTAFLFMIGGGTTYTFMTRYFADLSYRYGRTSEVSSDSEVLIKGLNTQRVQFGVGIRF